MHILVIGSDGTLLNQIPFEGGSRFEAEIWAKLYRDECRERGMDTDFSFRFIKAE